MHACTETAAFMPARTISALLLPELRQRPLSYSCGHGNRFFVSLLSTRRMIRSLAGRTNWGTGGLQSHSDMHFVVTGHSAIDANSMSNRADARSTHKCDGA